MNLFWTRETLVTDFWMFFFFPYAGRHFSLNVWDIMRHQQEHLGMDTSTMSMASSLEGWDQVGGLGQLLERGFVRARLGNQANRSSHRFGGGFLLSPKKSRVNCADANYFHCVVRVQDKHIKAMLRLSGSSGIYLVPKWPDQARDDRFRVIPVQWWVLALKIRLDSDWKSNITWVWPDWKEDTGV